MQTQNGQVQEQQKAKKVQQKIKLMMKYKKMQKLTSQKQLMSQKPTSIYNDKASRFDQISIKNKKTTQFQNTKQQQTFQTYSSKRIKSINQTQDINSTSSFNLKQSGKKFILSNKQRKALHQTDTLKKVPSAQKIQTHQKQQTKQSFKKLKRPSSVINKSTRATTSRTKKNRLQPEDQKQMEQKIRQIIPKCFDHGIKLQKYADQKGVDLNKQYQMLFNEEINIIRLINNSRKYYALKVQNQQEQQVKLEAGVQREIIQMLKKKRQKQSVINKCDLITDQISKLIDARLSALNKTKVSSF